MLVDDESFFCHARGVGVRLFARGEMHGETGYVRMYLCVTGTGVVLSLFSTDCYNVNLSIPCVKWGVSGQPHTSEHSYGNCIHV